MASRDLLNHIHPVPAIAPQVAADDTALASAIIDTINHESATFVLQTGTLADADATFAVTLEDGDDPALSDAEPVGENQMVGSLEMAGFTFENSSACRKLGYIGSKRYVRLTVTPTGNTGNAPISAVCLLGHPRSMPTSNPPA